MKPILQALVIADHVYQDVNGKKIIAGTFHGIKFSRKPPVNEVQLPDGTKRLEMHGGTSGPPYAYLSLTDVHKNTILNIQFVFLTRNEVLFQTQIKLDCENRLGTVEVIMPLPQLPIREAGIYALEVLCDGELIGTSRITAEDITPP